MKTFVRSLIFGLVCAVCAIQVFGTTFGPVVYSDKTFDSPLVSVGPFVATEIKAPKITVTGPANLFHSKVDKAVVSGPFQARELKALEIKVNGPTNLSHSEVGQVTVMGPLTTESTTFTDSAKVTGPVVAKKSTFLGPLSVTACGGDVLTLEDTKTKDIFFTISKRSTVSSIFNSVLSFFGLSEDLSVPRIILKGNTIIGSHLTITGGKAEVLYQDGARIQDDRIKII